MEQTGSPTEIDYSQLGGLALFQHAQPQGLIEENRASVLS